MSPYQHGHSTLIPMSLTHPLVFRNNHLYVEINGKLWVYDTGADTTFGDHTVSLFGAAQPVPKKYAGRVSADDVSHSVGETVSGIIGADLINSYDHIIDLKNNILTVSDVQLRADGLTQPLEFFMGVPSLFAMIESRPRNFVFDTGAQISYYQGEIPPRAERGPIIRDFYPGFGDFESESHFYHIELFGIRHRLQFGRLPDLMGMALQMMNCEGILGNEIIRNRVTGYFPRRKELILQA